MREVDSHPGEVGLSLAWESRIKGQQLVVLTMNWLVSRILTVNGIETLNLVKPVSCVRLNVVRNQENTQPNEDSGVWGLGIPLAFN